MSTGSFETITSTKIKTKYGTILKVTKYFPDWHPETEYKIKPKCMICNESLDCMCYQEDNDFTFEDVVDGLQRGMVCDKPSCVIEFESTNSPENLAEQKKTYKDDEYGLRDAIWETWGEWDDGPAECGV